MRGKEVYGNRSLLVVVPGSRSKGRGCMLHLLRLDKVGRMKVYGFKTCAETGHRAVILNRARSVERLIPRIAAVLEWLLPVIFNT